MASTFRTLQLTIEPAGAVQIAKVHFGYTAERTDLGFTRVGVRRLGESVDPFLTTFKIHF